ncbi:hypothetical protein SARI_02090 [Salmonella enterica subsp. arizonae serovar 62:z4,z23:-]|uniref:Uncharacterized protein n=1 Tax=Salmonella arizonae (strain ATCC BAA-731 / CDC346-86 / RSK2980) TaxID=41514 RepID=A9MIR4_SALAR|nr:hypothetical protein SARI_02090 [Salmonella enterica subsp. arizonae serovar 62:z4,z23:-]
MVLLFSSQNIFFPAVDLLIRSLYLLAALNILRLAVANPIRFFTHNQASNDPSRQG